MDVPRTAAPPVRGAQRKTANARGVIDPTAAARGHARYLVDPPVDAWLEHWWTVSWSLPPGERQVAQTLGHPCVHVVEEAGEVRVVGVVRGRFTRVLEGSGRVFGAKFWPGAFRPLLGAPVSTLTDRVVPFADVVGAARARDYGERLARAPDDGERVALATAFFAELLPEPPRDLPLLRRMLAEVERDRSLRSVKQLVDRYGIHLRELQRWFRDAVGISPKWVIQRYRLHEALLALGEGGPRDVARLAHQLGYADQAHFSRDFRALVGVPPSEYGKGPGRSGGAAR